MSSLNRGLTGQCNVPTLPGGGEGVILDAAFHDISSYVFWGPSLDCLQIVQLFANSGKLMVQHTGRRDKSRFAPP